MNQFLSHIHTHLRQARLTRQGATMKPEDVPRGIHKEYARMPQVTLPSPSSISTTLTSALSARRSGFTGDTETQITLTELGTLFGLSLKKHTDVHNRPYPSGGALYPIETYLVSTAVETQTAGIFHYNPTKHVLERLWDIPNNFDMKDIAKKPETLPLSSLIVFTSVWQRSSAKYGDLAYLHSLLEAGHMSQNMLLVGCALGLSVRPYAGFNDALLTQLLDLNECEEQTVHTITMCKAPPTVTSSTFTLNDI